MIRIIRTTYTRMKIKIIKSLALECFKAPMIAVVTPILIPKRTKQFKVAQIMARSPVATMEDVNFTGELSNATQERLD